MNKSVRIGFIGGAVCLIVGIVAILSPVIPKVVSHILLDAGAFTFTLSLFYHFKKDALICDERNMRVVMYSLAYSWFATIAMVMVLVWGSIFHWLTLTVPIILIIIVLFMALSGFFFYLYFNKRGTV
jgi:hypothetical protein